MATKRDYYQMLGVNRDAGPEEIKKAYRKKALEYHPDRNPGDDTAEGRFKEASEAYDVLSNAEKRQLYDRYGHEGLRNAGFQGFSGFGVEEIFSSFGDLFEDFFGFGMGGRGAGLRPRAGHDLRYDLSLNLREAVFGTQQEVELPRLELCPTCGGSGAEPGTQPEVCSTCQGRGRVSTTQGFFSITTTCPRCRGEGKVIRQRCPDCRGEGRVRRSRTVSIKIPPGVDDGLRLRLQAEGEAGEFGGPPGDLYVFIHVEPDEHFRRAGDDIFTPLTFSFPQVALGDEVKVETLDGEETVTLPAGSQTGDQIRLRGHGAPNLRSGRRGDQVIEVRVETPTRLSDRQQELLREFARLEEEKPKKQSRWKFRK